MKCKNMIRPFIAEITLMGTTERTRGHKPHPGVFSAQGPAGPLKCSASSPAVLRDCA